MTVAYVLLPAGIDWVQRIDLELNLLIILHREKKCIPSSHHQSSNETDWSIDSLPGSEQAQSLGLVGTDSENLSDYLGGGGVPQVITDGSLSFMGFA